MARWTAADIPDQTGRTAIVTGANTGIGFETALALYRKGAGVILACRSPERGRDALDRIRAVAPATSPPTSSTGPSTATAGASPSLEVLDLADLQSVAAFASRVRDAYDRLDLLILNAGVMVPPESTTRQGFELQLGVNHLGHFALTGHLLPLVMRTDRSRVVTVSSTAARLGRIDFDDLHFRTRGYAATRAYGQSKLANQLFAAELHRRLTAAGSSTLSTAAHPGWTATDLQRTAPLYRLLNPILAMKPPQGALPTLRAATDPDARGGDYFGPDGLFQVRGYPVRVEMVHRARRTADAARLWDVSEELTGVRVALPTPAGS